MKQKKSPETRLAPKSRKEILLKPFPNLSKRSIHTHAYHLAPVQAEPAQTPCAPQVSQPLVLKDLIAHRFVPADARVACALNEYARAMREPERGILANERKRGGKQREDNKIEHRHQCLFPEADQ